MGVEEFGRTHSITGGRDEEVAAEQVYYESRRPIWEQATSTDPPHVYARGEEILIRTAPGYGSGVGVGNLFEQDASGRYVHESSPEFALARRVWESRNLVFGESFPDGMPGAGDPTVTVSADPA